MSIHVSSWRFLIPIFFLVPNLVRSWLAEEGDDDDDDDALVNLRPTRPDAIRNPKQVSVTIPTTVSVPGAVDVTVSTQGTPNLSSLVTDVSTVPTVLTTSPSIPAADVETNNINSISALTNGTDPAVIRANLGNSSEYEL